MGLLLPDIACPVINKIIATQPTTRKKVTIVMSQNLFFDPELNTWARTAGAGIRVNKLVKLRKSHCLSKAI